MTLLSMSSKNMKQAINNKQGPTLDTESTVADIKTVEIEPDQTEQVVEAFKSLYQILDKQTLSYERMLAVYANDVMFEDSLHSLLGIDAMMMYFEQMYENVSSIEFDFHDTCIKDHQAFITWTMTFCHKSLHKGRPIHVEGITHLMIEGERVMKHRDYFDAGQMLYEHIPVLSIAIKALKRRLA